MRCEWSAQRARRVRTCAVLVMHVRNRGIHTLWRFTCTPNSPLFSSSQVSKESVCSCVAVALKEGCLKRLGLFCVRFIRIHTMHGE